MKKVAVIVLLIISFNVYGFDVFDYATTFSLGSEGFSQVFSPFNSLPFGVFSSPQSIDFSQNYSIGVGFYNVGFDPSVVFSSHFKPFSFPIALGIMSSGYDMDIFNKYYEYIGSAQKSLIIFSLGTKFEDIISLNLGKVSVGTSLVFGIDGWTFPYGVYDLTDYILESMGGLTLGGILNNDYFDLSLSQSFIFGGYYGDTSFGFSLRGGLRFSPLKFIDEKLSNYLFLFPYLSFSSISSYPQVGFVDRNSSFTFGIGFVSNPLEDVKISFSIDNRGLSFSILLSLFSSPIGFGSVGSQKVYYEDNPSLYILFTEKGFKEISGISKDKIEVEQGIIEFEKGNFKESQSHFEKALSYNPSNQVALMYIEKLKLRLEQDEWLTQEQREYIKVLLERAELLKSQRKYGDAIKEYKKVLEINPYNATANGGIKEIEKIVSDEVNKNYKEALALYSKNQLLEAQRVINKNFDLNPYHDPSLKLSREIQDKIDYETTKSLELEQKKTLSYSLYSQGMTEFSSYNFSKALELFNKALEIYPDNKDAEEAVKKTLKEIEISTKMKQDKARSDALVAEGIKLRNEGKYWESIQKFGEAIRFFNDNQVAKTEISNTFSLIRSNALAFDKEADNLFVNGNTSKAFELWDKAITLLGELPDAVAIKQKVELKKSELQSSIDINIANAKDFLSKDDFLNAMKTIQIVLALDPTNKEALDIYNKSKSSFDRYVDSNFSNGISYYNSQNYEKALSIFEDILNVLPNTDPRYAKVKSYYDDAKKKYSEYNIARQVEDKLKEVEAFLANYDYEGAKKALEDILKIDPNNQEVRKQYEDIKKKSEEVTIRDEANKLLSLGLREVRKGNYIEGIDYLKKAKDKLLSLGDDVNLVSEYIQKAEEQFSLMKNKAFIEGKDAYQKGDYITAKEKLEIALKNNPQSSEIKELLTEVNNKLKIYEKDLYDKAEKLFISGEYDKSLDLYNKLLSISSDNDLYNFKIQNIQRIKEGMSKVSNLMIYSKYSDALDIVEDIININPNDKNLANLRDAVLEKLLQFISQLRKEADEYISKQDYRKAISRLEIILKANPNDVDASSKLSFARNKLSERVSLNLNKGKAEYDKGNYNEAIKFLSLALEDDPKNPLASSLLSDARRKYNEIISKNKANLEREVSKYMALGVEEYRKGNSSKAVEYWQKVLELDPLNEQARKYIARAKLGQ
ncbi:MAG: tetratricopeptide repeat protein [Brevinematia bacterium]